MMKEIKILPLQSMPFEIKDKTRRVCNISQRDFLLWTIDRLHYSTSLHFFVNGSIEQGKKKPIGIGVQVLPLFIVVLPTTSTFYWTTWSVFISFALAIFTWRSGNLAIHPSQIDTATLWCDHGLPASLPPHLRCLFIPDDVSVFDLFIAVVVYSMEFSLRLAALLTLKGLGIR